MQCSCRVPIGSLYSLFLIVFPATGEDGLPGIGVLLKVMDESQPIEDMFKALDTDAFVVNLGPGGGRFLALKNVDDMIEASITKAKFTYPKWAGMHPSTVLTFKWDIRLSFGGATMNIRYNNSELSYLRQRD